MSDQDRISPYNISTISIGRQVMRIEKNMSSGGLKVDQIPNSQN